MFTTFLAGDPLEVELFNTTKWTLKVPMGNSTKTNMIAVPASTQPNGLKEHIILRQFEFSPEKLRAVTLMSRPASGGPEHVLLVKGSPEMIFKMSKSETIPSNIENELTTLAKQGFRVLALAYRVCSEPLETLMAASQTDLETGADGILFLGLVYFSNKLKNDTYPATITALQSADIHVNMITGMLQLMCCLCFMCLCCDLLCSC